jgi:hypothetical protein
VVATLSSPPTEGQRIPELQDLLSLAREAERAATGAGTGASAFNLRVESAVPVADVERALYTAAQAGYAAPRVVLRAGDEERAFPWPIARPRAAPSREELERALRDPSSLRETRSTELRLELDDARVRVGESEQRGTLDVAALERALSPSREPVLVAVDPRARFARLAAVLQVLGTAREVRVRVVVPSPR